MVLQRNLAVAFFILSLASLGAVQEVNANWFTKLLKEAGEAGVDAGKSGSRIGIAALDDAARAVKHLPEPADGRLVLAGHATPEGHWTFVNREGASFTAATPDEMARLTKALAPEVPEGTGVNLYISEETLFLRKSAMDSLPSDARLNVVVGKKTFPISRKGGAGTPTVFVVRVRKNVVVPAGEQAAFHEAMWQLDRSLSRSDVRVLSLKPGSAKDLSASAKFDAARKVPLADEIDPARLGDVLPGIRGQTAVVTGRIEGDLLYVLPSSGGEQALSLSAIRNAAAGADVNLVVLHSSKALQPGGQNWLWQTVKVDGLSKALEKTTFGDFLDSLAGGRGELVVKSAPQGERRVIVEALPTSEGRGLVDNVGTWVGDTVLDVTGHVITEGVQAFMNSEVRQKELDQRILPGIPSDWQFYYIGAILMGLFGGQISQAWWKRIWPLEVRGEYNGSFGFYAARTVRLLAFVFVFLPIVGPFALLAAGFLKLFEWLMLPVKAIRWLIGYRTS